MIKFLILILISFVQFSYALDLYNSNNGQLTIPTVLVDNVAYSDVVVKVADVISVGSAPANGVIDFYNASTGKLTIPSVQAGNSTYYNVVASVAGVISVGGSSQRKSKLTLSQVRSYEYVIASTTGTSNINNLISNSNADLVILNWGPNNPTLNKTAADQSGTKLIFGYIDVGEADQWGNPSLFSNGIPNWFGNLNPGYNGLYTVQYWNPKWQQQIFNNIDKIISQGYDGIFLDVLSANNQWSQGNIYNNPINNDALQNLVTLIESIRNYINTKYSEKGIYLIGNNPFDIALSFPQALNNLDGIFIESVFNSQNPTNGSVSLYRDDSSYITSLVSIYKKTNITVLGNDYPALNNATAILQGLDFYNSLGVTPSINLPFQTADILQTGPFLSMANATFNRIVGTKGAVNFLAGGLQSNVVLIGGDKGDYFIGGPGQNTIQGGNGNDTIYAHSANSNTKNQLVISYNSTNKNSSTPQLSVIVNGSTLLSNYVVSTSIDGSLNSTVTVNIPANTAVTSLKLIVTNCSQIGSGYPNQYSNFSIKKIVLQSQSINLQDGKWSNNLNQPGLFNNNDTAIFPNLIPVAYLNTSDQIDGGGGINTVVYRANKSNYSVSKQSNGSYLVTSQATAEGPDTLTNIQVLQFADQSMNLN